MSGVPRAKPATLDDYLAHPDHERLELIQGVLVERGLAGSRHGFAAIRLGGGLNRRFNRRPGGTHPGGWWIASEVTVRFGEEIFQPDLLGWRRDRVPELPLERPVTTRPDWVCEILSPSNARTDRVSKLRTYHRCEVPHYWLLDPDEETLTVLRYSPGGYVVVLTAPRDEVVAAEPFEAMRFRVGVLFGDEPDEDF